jgi:hypothetical protein
MAKSKNENAVTVYDSSKFLALGGASGDVQAAMAAIAEVGEEFTPGDLTRVKTPQGGSTTWMIPSVAGEQPAEAITGVLCGIQKTGVLWGSEEPEEGSMPVLRTWDLEIAQQMGPIPDDMIDHLEPHRVPGTTDKFYWKDLPYNQFGTAKGGEGAGKRCKEQRMLFILREQDMFPLIVTAQPGSLKDVRKFILSLPQIGKPFWHAVVELRLTAAKSRGDANGRGRVTFAQISPKVVGVLSDEDAMQVHQRFTLPLMKMATSIDPDVAGHAGDDDDHGDE